MEKSQTSVNEPKTVQLRLASGQEPVTRTVLQTPPRDALPSEIPVIDISRVFSPSIDDRRAVAREIGDAAANIGFFYISNHGVPDAVITGAYKTALAFFRQDLETKLRAKIAPSQGKISGYRPFASQRINPDEGADHRETFSWAYDATYDPEMGDINAVPQHARKYIKVDESPWEATSQMPELKAALVAYFQSCLGLARALTRSFALSLDLPEDHLDSKVKYPDVMMLLNYYPKKEPQPPAGARRRVSMGSHTDFRLFTILWQDSTGGLQILNRDGQWINGLPVPGTFVVNIGDFLQRITNDRYVSTVHRAQSPSGEERVSIPFFWGFGLHERCGVLESCVGEGEAPKYDEISTQEYVASRSRQLVTWGNETDGEKSS
ncbi:2OG-Fe(II) oxygenase [Metarhizium guizhouense ARSEF 977]|uniref:2OG-Fe(II) oxygenase n=1 Tax=Metarhizium guizhouense (strain ARSEF 977) TaxID=1276136 RepID=A0A0B4HKM7_METGA|nr:2OG-Fe(II) oxygenase [Metarhizium guizhouense ARSEF 977]